jgi:hypothetical protein
MTVPSSSVVILPSPSMSNKLNASLSSAQSQQEHARHCHKRSSFAVAILPRIRCTVLYDWRGGAEFIKGSTPSLRAVRGLIAQDVFSKVEGG